ncbi:MAG TPA: hypothetical protein VE988_09575, partial [Gemmataceae bacterium]|nr:hypothetical protein [Gemmataceae bacterium]
MAYLAIVTDELIPHSNGVWGEIVYHVAPVPTRANASNSTGIIARILIWSSVQAYDSPVLGEQLKSRWILGTLEKVARG